MEDKNIYELIAGYCSGTLSGSEAKRLRHLVDHDPEALKLFKEIRGSHKVLNTIQAHEQTNTREAWEELSRLLTPKPQNHRIQWIIGTAIAASVALLLIFLQPDSRTPHTPESPIAQASIEPGGIKAVLTYSNGEEIRLTSSTSSHITAPDGSIIVNDSLEGLQYNKQNTGQTDQFQTLSVPAGGEYRFTLADGTRVWVILPRNSGSPVNSPVIKEKST